MKLKLIPAGEFLMGSGAADKWAKDREKPQHRVNITKPFSLGIYPVTQDEYEQVVGENPSKFKGDGRHPVDNVSWFDAVNFCNCLSEQEDLKPYYKIGGETVSVVGGTGYRLPTEAEWEYACRAGTMTKWSFGDDESLLTQYAWYKVNSGSEPHAVGELKPNSWGMYDMHGNIREWCWDWYDDEYFQHSPSADPNGPSSGEYRVLRGGSCYTRSAWVRSAQHLYEKPARGSFNFGFRPSRTYPPIKKEPTQ
jgi:formylglycine-generating enzyme required for sulfatase activity